MKLKLGYPVKFKKVKLPSKKKLIGKYCNLEPINIRKHSKDLFKNFSLDKKGIDWVYMTSGPFKDETSLKKYMKDKNLAGNPFFLFYLFKMTNNISPIFLKVSNCGGLFS